MKSRAMARFNKAIREDLNGREEEIVEEVVEKVRKEINEKAGEEEIGEEVA